MSVGSPDRNPVELLSEEFLARIRRGEAVTAEEYAQKHPELADEILAVFPALLMMEDLGGETSDLTASLASGTGVVVGATAGRLDEFRLLREVGRGGMGVVYEAEQESLGRRVALKVLSAGALVDAQQIRRFEREARSAARLHHTNIVPVFGVGEYEGTHYYVMQFIQGQGLNSVLDELKKLRDARTAKPTHQAPTGHTEKQRAAADIAHSLATGRFVAETGTATSPAGDAASAGWTGVNLPHSSASAHHTDSSFSSVTGISGTTTLSETDRRFAQGVARIGVQVAEALAYAHGQGVLHRDIKPSNLLLDREGNVWVADFGLAKATGTDDLTHTGDIVGTVRYMAPERFRGESDARSDLYALGLTLYELLALRPAFDESDRASLMRQVTQEDPPRLRRLNSRVPHDLETIIHKAIAREPGQRYASSKAMAEDLARFLDGRPILARRVSTTERVYRWCRRNPIVAGLLGMVAALIVAGLAGSIAAAVHFRQTAASESAARHDAELARSQAGIALSQAVQARGEADRRRQEAETSGAQARTKQQEAEASYALARKAVDDSFTKVSESALLAVPGMRPLRRDLLQSALAFYEEFLRREANDPSVLADLAATQFRVGQILADLSEQDKARVALRRSVELYDKALAARPGDVTMLERQSEVWHRLGDLDYRQNRRTANEAYRSAVAIREKLAADSPREPRFRMALSRSFNGVALTVDSDDEQLDAYRHSLELRLKLAEEIPDDPDLLHGLSESFLNMGVLLWQGAHREEALELLKHAIEYGRAGLARRPHDLEFALDLAVNYSQAAAFLWQLNRRDEALAISTDGVEFCRKLSVDNPDVRAYRDALSNALGTHAQYQKDMGRIEDAVSYGRQAAEMLETKPDPDEGALASAAIFRMRLAALLAGDSADQDFKTWPDAARREADLSVADFKGAVARGFRRADIVRATPESKALLGREDMKALLAEMEHPSPKPVNAQTKGAADAAPSPSPLDRPGRLEEDRFLGELSIGLLEDDAEKTSQTQNRLETMLARVQSRLEAGADSPALEASARSIRLKIGERLWKAGELAGAKRIWDEILAPPRRSKAITPERPTVLATMAPASERIVDLFVANGLWELASPYDGYFRAGYAQARFYRCFESGALALARGDRATYREIVAEAVSRISEKDDYGIFNALRSATLSPDSPVAPRKLVEMGERLNVSGGLKWWHRVIPANALLRAGRDKEALAAIEADASSLNGKAIVGLIHARSGRSEQAERWLLALERDLEVYIQASVLAYGEVRQPHYWPFDVLRADILRREAYTVLGEKAREVRALRLLRGAALWRLHEREQAEAEFAAARAGALEEIAGLVSRARTFETLGLHDRADADLAEAARQKPDDPRPWVMRGKLFAERGQGKAADAAYARAAQLAPGRLDPFLKAGWWIAGPYPEDMSQPQPPELDPDPSRTVAGVTSTPLRWRPAGVNEDRYVFLAPFAGRPAASVYALTHIASDRDRTALLCLSGRDRLHIWLNGRIVFDSTQSNTYRAGPEFLVPVSLRAGRNTLLVRVSHSSDGHDLRLRSDDFELDRAYLTAEFGRWPEAAKLLDQADDRHQILHPWPMARRAELLAALGDKDRYLRTAALLADFDGAARPDPYDVAITLGLMPNDLVSHDRLIEIARQAVALNQSETWRQSSLALAYYRAGRFREALDQLPARLRADDRIASAIAALAHWRLGQKDAAREALAAADAKFDTWCRERLSGRGSRWTTWWFDGFQLIALRREAHELMNGRPTDDVAALAKIRSAMGNLLDDRDSPTWAYDLALRLEPGNIQYRNALAARLTELGRIAEAEPQLAAMIEGKTTQPHAWVNRGMLLAQSGRPDRAAADFAKALELIPRDFDVFGARTRVCTALIREPAAFERLLTLRPSDALLWYTRAAEHLTRRAPKAAVADFVRGGEPPATTDLAHVYAAALLLAGDQIGYARYVSRQADLHGDTTAPFTCYVLARMAMLADRPPVSPHLILEWASRAVKQQPQVAWYAHAQGLAALRAGDMETARRALEESARLPWNDGSALNLVAQALIDLREGRAETARARFDRARASLDLPPALGRIAGKLPLMDWLEFQVLRPQVEGPLYDRVFPTDVFIH
jgi:serine/threonine protein kinase/Tfp pilus assembly protein PilF